MSSGATHCAGKGAEHPESVASLRQANLANIRFLWRYTLPHRKQLILAVAISLPLAAIGGILPWLFQRGTQHIVDGKPLESLAWWMLLAILLLVCLSACEVINQYFLLTLHEILSNDIRNDLYSFLQGNSLELHTAYRSGELASLISNDSQSAAAGVIELYSAVWLSPLQIILLSGTMFYFNPAMSLFALISLPFVSWCVTIAGKKAQKADRQYLNHLSKVFAWMIESLTNIRQVKSFGLEEQGAKRLKEYGAELITFRKRTILLKALATPVAEISNGLALVAMVVLAYYQLRHGMTTSGDIVGCLAAAIGLKKPVKMISGSFVQLQRSVAAVQRLGWLTGREQGAEGQKHQVSGPIHTIEFRDVSFSYDGKRKVLQHVNFKAKKGERLAIIGPSGAGKSTMLDLLTGFYPCTQGDVVIDGRTLGNLDLRSLNKHIGIVSQEPFLFDGSIEDNIRSGHPEASSAQFNTALFLTKCDKILSKLPDGLHARVGERGAILSGGERKRVALARALIRPISLLILDEATSELDEQTEQAILTDIDKLAEDLIILHISHRDSVLHHCDRLLVLNNGRLNETTPADYCSQLSTRKRTPRLQVRRMQ